MRKIGVLPTLVTLANGFCGVLAIFKAADALHAPPDQQMALLSASAQLIMLAMVFDVFDGKIARITGVTSQFGAYLDSLCDAVSFGAAPAFLAKSLFEIRFPYVESGSAFSLPPQLLTFLTLTFALGALMRLARYNLEHAAGEGADREGKDVSHFDGLPTPGATGVLAALVFLATESESKRLMDYSWVMAALPFMCLALAYLMVSRLPYVHFGNRFLRGRRDLGYVFSIVVAIALAAKFPHEALAVVGTGYLVSGPAAALLRRLRPGSVEAADVEQETAP